MSYMQLKFIIHTICTISYIYLCYMKHLRDIICFIYATVCHYYMCTNVAYIFYGPPINDVRSQVDGGGRGFCDEVLRRGGGRSAENMTSRRV